MNKNTITKDSNIAIVNCKAKKQDYICSADEMYSISFVYRAQREFFIEGYDDYYIISSKYGIIHNSQIIEPYNMTVFKNPNIKGSFSTTDKHKDEQSFWQLVNKQLKWMISKDCKIHFHSSKDYFNPLDSDIKEYIKYVKQPVAFGSTKNIYNKATEMFKNGSSLDSCLEFITSKHPSKYNEVAKWFYHPIFGKYHGKATDLNRNYPDVTDLGCLYQLSTNRMKQHKGWVIDEKLLDRVIKQKNGRWKLSTHGVKK